MIDLANLSRLNQMARVTGRQMDIVSPHAGAYNADPDSPTQNILLTLNPFIYRSCPVEFGNQLCAMVSPFIPGACSNCVTTSSTKPLLR
jgi:hypothetical protein